MTVKEIMDITGKSRDAIIGRIKKLFPKMVFEPRKKVDLTDEQARSILESYHPGYDLSGDAIAKQDKTESKTVRIIHDTKKIELTGALLKEMGKYLSRDEMRDFLLTAPLVDGHRLLENKKKENGDETD